MHPNILILLHNYFIYCSFEFLEQHGTYNFTFFFTQRIHVCRRRMEIIRKLNDLQHALDTICADEQTINKLCNLPNRETLNIYV